MPGNAKLAKIYIAKNELALTDDAYRDILYLRFQVESAANLTDQQATELLNLFKAKGWVPKITDLEHRLNAQRSSKQ